MNESLSVMGKNWTNYVDSTVVWAVKLTAMRAAIMLDKESTMRQQQYQAPAPQNESERNKLHSGGHDAPLQVCTEICR